MPGALASAISVWPGVGPGATATHRPLDIFCSCIHLSAHLPRWRNLNKNYKLKGQQEIGQVDRRSLWSIAKWGPVPNIIQERKKKFTIAAFYHKVNNFFYFMS